MKNKDHRPEDAAELCRRADEALRQSAERHRAILQTAMDGFWLVDTQGRLLEVNGAYCRMSGYSTQELLAMRISDLEAVEAAGETAAHVQKIMAQGEDRFESRHRRKDGGIFDVEVSVQYQAIEGGRMVTFLRDITRPKRAEEELRETKNFLENLTNYANVPIIVWDPQFQITRFNHAFEFLTGRTVGEVIGRNLKILFPQAQVQRSMQLIKKTLRGERWETVEINILHIDGSVRTVLWNSANIADPQGNITATIAQGHDITERKQAEERLFNSKATLIMAIDGISDPLFMLDAEFRVKRLNRAARDYFGLTHYREAIGKLCFEARGKPRPCEGCEHPFSDMRGYSGSYERKGAMDPDRIEQVFVDVVKDASGAPEATIVRIYDITQTRMMDRQLIQSEKLASLGMLIAGIAHEINNPNNFIFFNTPILRSYLQFLLPIVDEHILAHPELMAFGRPYPVFREDCFKLLDNIAHGSIRINQIVGNLREFVRERGKGETRRIDLMQVVEKGISICLERIKKIVKTFEVNIPEGLPTLFADPLAMEQVVVNLLINAAQAADKNDSWVRLTITSQKEPEGEVILEVSDNGCGMDTETQKKIFDPFFTTKAVGVGTGLGLSISYRLVTEMRGRIEVCSEVGKGSIFRVILKT